MEVTKILFSLPLLLLLTYSMQASHLHSVIFDYDCSQSYLSHFKYSKTTARSFIPSDVWLWFSDAESEIKLLFFFFWSVLRSLSIILAVATVLRKEQKLLALTVWEFADRNNKVAQSLLKCWWDSQQITLTASSSSQVFHIYIIFICGELIWYSRRVETA